MQFTQLILQTLPYGTIQKLCSGYRNEVNKEAKPVIHRFKIKHKAKEIRMYVIKLIEIEQGSHSHS